MRLNLPTILTLGRVAVIPMVLGLFYVDWPQARHLACILFGAAAFTDWLDGYLARLWNQTSTFGAFLDPVADKLLVAVCLVMLLRFGPPQPLLDVLVAIIIGREITISALREWLAELGERRRVAVGWVGKFKTAFQMLAIGFMLWQTPLETPIGEFPVYDFGYILLLAASVLTLWSMVVYIRAAWPVLRGRA
jgi:CDP-diacylglycerol--glycerol-3-phosphate 3-phosphatidyltransferase